MPDAERTEEASPRKLRLARERGEVPQSRLLGAAILALGAATWLSLLAPSALNRLRALAADTFASPTLSPRDALARASVDAASVIAIPVALAVVLAVIAGLLQVGPLFAPKTIAPDPARLDLARGLRRMLSGARLGEALLSLVLVVALVLVALAPWREGLHGLLGRISLAPGALAAAMFAVLAAIAWRASGVLAVAGVLDAIRQRHLFLREQRMTRRELMREHRETEGDPGARRRRTELMRELALGPALGDALGASILAVRSPDAIVLVSWPNLDLPACVAFVARGVAIDRVDRALRARRMPVARDAGLVAVLSRVRPGAFVPREAHARLARQIARSCP